MYICSFKCLSKTAIFSNAVVHLLYWWFNWEPIEPLEVASHCMLCRKWLVVLFGYANTPQAYMWNNKTLIQIGLFSYLTRRFTSVCASIAGLPFVLTQQTTVALGNNVFICFFQPNIEMWQQQRILNPFLVADLFPCCSFSERSEPHFYFYSYPLFLCLQL